MAITDNSFTASELAAAIQTNPALAAELKTFGTTAGYAVRSTAEETEYLKNYETNVIGKKTSEFANNIEKDILETSGVAKLENEKYHDYMKRVITENKTKLGTMESELKTLKESSGGSAGEKSRITQLENAIAAEKAGYTEKLTAKDTEIHKLKTSYAIEKDLAPLRVKYQPGIPASIAAIFEQNVISTLIPKIKDIDGTLVVLGEDNNPVLDATTFKPKTLAQVLEESMADILDKGKQQTGAGTAGGDGGAGADQTGLVKDAEGKVTSVASVPADVKTRIQLTDHLLKLGLTVGSKEYNDAMAKFGEKLPLR